MLCPGQVKSSHLIQMDFLCYPIGVIFVQSVCSERVVHRVLRPWNIPAESIDRIYVSPGE